MSDNIPLTRDQILKQLLLHAEDVDKEMQKQYWESSETIAARFRLKRIVDDVVLNKGGRKNVIKFERK